MRFGDRVERSLGTIMIISSPILLGSDWWRFGMRSWGTKQ